MYLPQRRVCRGNEDGKGSDRRIVKKEIRRFHNLAQEHCFLHKSLVQSFGNHWVVRAGNIDENCVRFAHQGKGKRFQSNPAVKDKTDYCSNIPCHSGREEGMNYVCKDNIHAEGKLVRRLDLLND